MLKHEQCAIGIYFLRLLLRQLLLKLLRIWFLHRSYPGSPPFRCRESRPYHEEPRMKTSFIHFFLHLHLCSCTVQQWSSWPRYRLWVFNILKLSCTLEEEGEAPKKVIYKVYIIYNMFVWYWNFARKQYCVRDSDQQRFILSKVTTDWHELIVPQWSTNARSLSRTTGLEVLLADIPSPQFATLRLYPVARIRWPATISHPAGHRRLSWLTTTLRR